MIKRILTTILAVTAGVLTLQAQVLKVSGTVTEAATGEPLIGVSVAIQGTTRGVVTNLDGQYTLEAGADATLVFGYLGYTTVTEPIKGRSVVNVTMDSDINTLDAAISMGYSSVRKTELSSAVSTVQGESLRDVSSNDLGTLLQGKVAGLEVYSSSGNPNSGSTIRIRGTGSISANSDPLYVVDGVVGGTFNPNDVESVTVLKDAGATGIYGASGSGGVIVVTTKQAKRGQDSQVEVRLQTGLEQIALGRFSMMNSQELYDYSKLFMSKGSQKQLDNQKVLETDTDWIAEATQPGLKQDYYVSASGSQGKLTYLASMDYFDNNGIVKQTRYRKLSGRVNVGAEILPRVTLNVRMNYDKSWSLNRGALSLQQMPWDNPYDVNTGEVLYVNSNTRSDNGKSWWGRDVSNPFWGQKMNSSSGGGSFFSTNLLLTWNITDFLTFQTTNTYGESHYQNESVTTPESKNSSFPDGYAGEDASWSQSFGTTNVLRYSQTFAGKHSVSALLGLEWGTSWDRGLGASGTGIANGIRVLSSLNPYEISSYWTEAESWSAFGQVMYSFMEKYVFSATLRADASSVFAPGNRVGYFPSVSASWLISNEDFMKAQNIISFLKLRASWGTTGNSGIGNYRFYDTYSFDKAYQYEEKAGGVPQTNGNPNLKWETAVKMNVGLDVSVKNIISASLDFYSNQNRDLLLNNPNISYTSGFTGRLENIGVVQNTGVELSVTSNNIVKRNFRWSTTLNIGHNRNVVKQLANNEPLYAGTTTVKQVYQPGIPMFSWYMPKWLGVDPETGDPLWEHFVTEAELELGVYDPSEYKVGDRVPSNALNFSDSQIVGCAQPDFSGGLVNTFQWGNFDASLNLTFQVGNEVYNYTRITLDADGAYPSFNSMSLNNGLGWVRWVEDDESTHAIATHPKAKLNGNKNANGATSRYLEDGSYLRIKNLTLGYTLPSNILKKIHMKNLRVFLSFDNLYTFTKFSGVDPEVNIAGNTESNPPAGTYNSNYPKYRFYSLGVNVKF